MKRTKLLGLGLCFVLFGGCQSEAPKSKQVELSSRHIKTLEIDDLRFRDLNQNGNLDLYEDWRQIADLRAADLLKRMTLEEKAGQIAHGNIFPNGAFGQTATGYDLEQFEALLKEQNITTILPFASLDYQVLAEQNNKIQEIAEKGRLGIPVTISTDPRHHTFDIFGVSAAGEGYSQWPEPLGFAALNDKSVTLKFAQIAGSELRATGFNQLLSPQADLSTEPRWSRIFQTFGEDPDVTAKMVAAYIEGFQGGAEGVVRGGVPTVVKHWVGYGAAKDGLDAHNYYGRYADLKASDFEKHLLPFKSAFEVNVSGVMPAYSVFQGLEVNGQIVEPVGAVYSEVLISNLLRRDHEFDGVVLSDWAITNDCGNICKNGRPEGAYPDPVAEAATGWGVQDLTRPERFALAMKVGVDQFGGVNDVSPILEAVESGLITENRLDQSVKRILTKSFRTGIFENPYVDLERASLVVNTAEAEALAQDIQSKAMVLLKTDVSSGPIFSKKDATYLSNLNADQMLSEGLRLSQDLTTAETAIVRIKPPFGTEHPNHFFGMQQNEASLAFADDSEEVLLLESLKAKGLRIIVDVTLDRPAILTNIVDKADVLIVNFGANDLALLRALDGTVPPQGRLPFELPSSIASVEGQQPGTPADSQDPLFALHFAASWSN